MTARTCPIHGEYSATGVCRWCEVKAMATAMPKFVAGATPCRCGECAWEPPCPPDMREGVIDRMFHSPEQCFKLDADSPAYDWTRGPVVETPEELARVANVDDAPPLNGRNILDAMHDAWVRMIWARLHDDMVEAANFVGSAAQQEHRLATEHAALRWERVARRWNWKHRRAGGLDEEGRARVWRHWLDQQQRIFDDGDWLERQRRRMDDLIAAGIPKE